MQPDRASACLLALLLVVAPGCYLVHERPADAMTLDGASGLTDGAADTGPGAWCPGAEPTACSADYRVVTLDRTASSTDRTACVTFEVVGSGWTDLGTPNGAAAGTHVRFVRCAPGGRMTCLHVTAIDEPVDARDGHVGIRADDCSWTYFAVRLGDNTIRLPVSSDTAQDSIGFLGDGTRYRVEACAFATADACL